VAALTRRAAGEIGAREAQKAQLGERWQPVEVVTHWPFSQVWWATGRVGIVGGLVQQAIEV
jgi:hypothetical protein